jgi:Rod binding domain-containing protein
MTINGASSLGMNPVATMGPRDSEQPKNLADAAQKFEALLMNQILSSAGDSEGGWLGTGETDQAGQQAMQLAQQQFADVLASQGGLGLSSLIVDRLHQQASQSAPGNQAATVTREIGKSDGGN